MLNRIGADDSRSDIPRQFAGFEHELLECLLR